MMRIKGENSVNIAVTATDIELTARAQAIATQLTLAYIPHTAVHDAVSCDLLLVLTSQGFVLKDGQSNSRLYLDFCNGPLAYRLQEFRSGSRQPLVRAVGLKANSSLSVLDLTAGWGRDALSLIALGCQLHLVERSAVVVLLLEDALQRLQASLTHPLSIQLTHQDARSYLSTLQPHQYPDVIYLDPMYPHRNKTALVKKDMRFLRRLVGADLDADELLTQALKRAKKRVVVKRPKGAPVLAQCDPSFVIKSPNTRYDIYV